MFVLGVDPGLAVTGYGVLAAGAAPQPVAAGAIRTDADAPVAERLSELFSDVEALIAEHEPVEIAIEQVFVNRNLKTATSVGRASGVVLLAAARAGIPVFEYTPSEVKLAVAGAGDAPKVQVQAMVARLLGLDGAPRPADAADALAVALCHLQSASLRRAIERAAT